uniref:Uncharacterized protein n=1 Tax=Staphylococcus aureus TaxID=1280 RepID=A0A0C6ERU7_STAAU|nr:phage protein [Staphylococcus aureus]
MHLINTIYLIMTATKCFQLHHILKMVGI